MHFKGPNVRGEHILKSVEGTYDFVLYHYRDMKRTNQIQGTKEDGKFYIVLDEVKYEADTLKEMKAFVTDYKYGTDLPEAEFVGEYKSRVNPLDHDVDLTDEFGI